MDDGHSAAVDVEDKVGSLSDDEIDSLLPVDALTVFIGTWNLHAQKAPDDLTAFIPLNAFDMYAIGTEECGQSIEVAVIYDDKTKWERQLIQHIGPYWAVVERVTLNAIHMIILVRRDLRPYLTEIEIGSVATGIANIIGNKGGVGISFRLGRTSFAFVNCHFHAHDRDVELRNADYHMINNNLNLAHRNPVSESFDVVFWFGDLNYRINGGRRMVNQLLKHSLFEVMKANEQLLTEMRKGSVFAGFLEGDLCFEPTYKFDRHSDVYDSSPKQRVPSWTDRILWKRNDAVQLLSYSSVTSCRTSDHRPVAATFNVRCRGATRKSQDDHKPAPCTIQ